MNVSTRAHGRRYERGVGEAPLDALRENPSTIARRLAVGA